MLTACESPGPYQAWWSVVKSKFHRGESWLWFEGRRVDQADRREGHRRQRNMSGQGTEVGTWGYLGWLEGGVGGGLSGPQAGPENKSLSISLKRQSSVLEAVGSHGLRHSFSVSVNVLGWISCFGGPSVHFRIFFSITGLYA